MAMVSPPDAMEGWSVRHRRPLDGSLDAPLGEWWWRRRGDRLRNGRRRHSKRDYRS